MATTVMEIGVDHDRHVVGTYIDRVDRITKLMHSNIRYVMSTSGNPEYKYYGTDNFQMGLHEAFKSIKTECATLQRILSAIPLTCDAVTCVRIWFTLLLQPDVCRDLGRASGKLQRACERMRDIYKARLTDKNRQDTKVHLHAINNIVNMFALDGFVFHIFGGIVIPLSRIVDKSGTSREGLFPEELIDWQEYMISDGYPDRHMLSRDLEAIAGNLRYLCECERFELDA